MPTIQLNANTRFEADPQESLLDAALKADITFEHSCRSGRCGSCKAKVSKGVTEALHAETGLSADEQQAGWVLTCVRRAMDDVELLADVLEGVRLPPQRNFPCKIQSLVKLADDVVGVSLRLPPGQVLQYLPGQYVDIVGRDGARRSYSLANAPRDDNLLELQIRQVPDGVMSNYWFGAAKANDLLQLKGPLGSFVMREAAGRHVVLLATGTGIAPIKALLEQWAQLDSALWPADITLLWGGRLPADLYWDPAALALPAAMKFRYVPVLSRADAGWAGARGHVQDVLLQAPPEWAKTSVYACGSAEMIDSARVSLLAAGLDAHQFFADAFLSSAPE